MTRFGGVVLCGGRSSRMGRPKAWLPFGGVPMLTRVAGLLSGVVSPVVAVAAPGQELPPLPAGVEVVRDPEEGRGPLAGLAAGLRALAGRADAAYLSACDVPFLSAAFVRRMLALLGDHAVCVPRADGYHHPLAAVYRVEAAAVAERLLAEGRARPVFLFESLPTREVTADELADVDPGLDSLRNLNTPEDYAAALRDEASRLPASSSVSRAAVLLLRALGAEPAAHLLAVTAVVERDFGGLVTALEQSGEWSHWPRWTRHEFDRAFALLPDVWPPLRRLTNAAGAGAALLALGEEVRAGLQIGDGWEDSDDFRHGVRELFASRLVSAALHLRSERPDRPEDRFREVAVDVPGEWWARPETPGFWSAFVTDTPARVRVVPGEEYELVAGPSATDDHLGSLRNVPALWKLTLVGSQDVSDRGVGRLWGLRLREIDLADVPRLTDAGLSNLATFWEVRRLTLGGTRWLTDVGLGGLGRLPRLESLSLWGCEAVTGSFIAGLTGSPLRELRLGACPHLTAAGLEPLARMAGLRTLGLTFCPGVDDNALVAVRDLTGLEALDLNGCDNISDAGLYHLWGLTGLRWLSLGKCAGVSDAAVDRLRDGLKACVITR